MIYTDLEDYMNANGNGDAPYGRVSPTPSMFKTHGWIFTLEMSWATVSHTIRNHQRLALESGFKCQLGAIRTNFHFANLLRQKCDFLY